MREVHLEQRLLALSESAELARGRLDDALVERAGAVIERAGERLGFGLAHTVVALAGATGVGKSRLFNRVVGAELAIVSRRRPTTSATRAAVWGGGADSLLGWLAVDERHQLPPDQLDGLVLLDLPDFDSVEAAHRLEITPGSCWRTTGCATSRCSSSRRSRAKASTGCGGSWPSASPRGMRRSPG